MRYLDGDGQQRMDGRGIRDIPKKLLTKFLDLLEILMTEEILPAELANKARICGGAAPTRERIVKSQEVRVLCGFGQLMITCQLVRNIDTNSE